MRVLLRDPRAFTGVSGGCAAIGAKLRGSLNESGPPPGVVGSGSTSVDPLLHRVAEDASERLVTDSIPSDSDRFDYQV